MSKHLSVRNVAFIGDAVFGGSSVVTRKLKDWRPANILYKLAFILNGYCWINFLVCRKPTKHHEVVKKEMGDLLKALVIKPADSPWGSPVVSAQKNNCRPHFCIEYWALDKWMKADKYPISMLKRTWIAWKEKTSFLNLIYSLGTGRYGLQSMQKITAFTRKFETFPIVVLLFRLINGLTKGQQMEIELFRGLSFEKVYIDDLVIFPNSLAEHIVHITVVCKWNVRAGLKLKLQKRCLGADEVEVLGNVVSPKGTQENLSKKKTIESARDPESKRELRWFLMFCSLFLRFIKWIAQIAAALHMITANKVPYR